MIYEQLYYGLSKIAKRLNVSPDVASAMIKEGLIRVFRRGAGPRAPMITTETMLVEDIRGMPEELKKQAKIGSEDLIDEGMIDPEKIPTIIKYRYHRLILNAQGAIIGKLYSGDKRKWYRLSIESIEKYTKS